MKRNAVIIIVVVVLGVVSTATYYASFINPNCGTAPTGGTPIIRPGSGGSIILDGQWWHSQNVTFTAADQQVIVGPGSLGTFQTTSFLDPSFPHPKGGTCASEPNLPFTVTLKMTTSGGSESYTFNYGGNPPAPPVYHVTGYTSPQAGVRWFQGSDSLNLLIACGSNPC